MNTRVIIFMLLMVSAKNSMAIVPRDESDIEHLYFSAKADEYEARLTASPEFINHNPSQRQILIIVGNLDYYYYYDNLAYELWHSFSRAQPKKISRESFRIGYFQASLEDEWDLWPPQSKTPYYGGKDANRQLLWRSLGWIAPDMIFIFRNGEKFSIGIPNDLPKDLTEAIKKSRIPTHALTNSHLASVLTSGKNVPAGVGLIPAIEFTLPSAAYGGSTPNEFLNFFVQLKKSNDYLGIVHLLQIMHEANLPEISPAHQELLNRRERSPLEIARQLDAVYGHELKTVMYQPALSLVARLNLDDLLGETSRHADVERIVADYAAGTKSALGDRPNGSVTSGHLIFSELARRADKAKYLPLVVKAAEQGFADDGSLLEAMPAHSEMSDSVFMGGPILAAAGRLTGDEKYYEMCLKHVRFMQQHCLREDDLYRHSPLDEAAWGRGNGFPALGLAWTLSEIPAEHPVHKELVNDLRNHLKALVKHQDPTGMWRQVIDEPGSYREMTATCMITFAMLRGLREGWLDERDFLPAVQAAWPAIQDRISSQGELIDVCTGTGKQKSLQAYFDRPAILGRDERGGAMAFLVVTEYARWLGK